MRHTKIICTLGPNENDEALMTRLAEQYMDVARFNFSHGDYAEHRSRLEVLKEVRRKTGRPIAALLDTKGPEIRTGELENHEKLMLEAGARVVLTTEPCVGTKERVFINYAGLPEDVYEGAHILIDDGLIDLKVLSVKGSDIYCEIENGGELGEKKGVNVPHISTKLPSLTEKDIEDIKFGIREDFDIVAASFVRDADCIREIRALLEENGSSMLIIAKIENQQGLDNIDEIIAEADGIMVARGDMGVEIEPQKIPHIQKTIIEKCNRAGKIVITATQMLDSMIRNPRPTRAEVNDVANAVYDGTDAVMLSGETAMGRYPYESLEMMAKIVEDTENFIDYDVYRSKKVAHTDFDNVTNAVSHAAISTAMRLHAEGVIAPTLTGKTAQMLSKWRPTMPVYAMSPSMTTVRKLMLLWGVQPFWSRRADSTDQLIENSLDELLEAGALKRGDLAVVTAGVLTYRSRNEAATDTNIMRVVEVK